MRGIGSFKGARVEELERRLLLTGAGEPDWVITAVGDSLGSGISPTDAANRGIEPRASYRPALWQLMHDSFIDPPAFEFVGSTDYNPTSLPTEGIRHSSHRGFATYSFFPHPNPNIGSDPQGEVNNNVWDADGWATFEADVALVLAGTNDVLEGRALSSIESTMRNIVTELRSDNANVEILLGTLPPMASDRPNFDDIPATNTMIRDLVLADGDWPGSTETSPIHIVDHYSGEVGLPAFDLDVHSDDGVHPNAVGDQLLAENWWSVLQPIVSEATTPPAPTVTISARSAVVDESESARFTVSRTGDTAADLIVNFGVSGSATAGEDYSFNSTSVTIPANRQSIEVVVPVVDDDVDEIRETITISLAEDADYLLGGQAKATIAIDDNDVPTVRVRVASTSFAESSDGTEFQFQRSGDLTSSLRVQIEVDGTAASGDDYVRLPSEVEFLPGKSTATLSLKPIDDKVDEPNETVTVGIVVSSIYDLASESEAKTQIVDDDEPVVGLPNVSVRALTEKVAEGEAVKGYAVSRDGDLSAPLVVKLRVAGNATTGEDYKELPEQVTIPAGKKSVTLRLATKNDQLDERNERVVVHIRSASRYAITNGKAVAVIVDDDLPRVGVKRLDPKVQEGEKLEAFEVFRKRSDNSKDLVVHMGSEGTAKAGKDYKALPNKVTIPAGKDSVTVTLKAIDDRLDEPVETVVYSLKERKQYERTNQASATVKVIDNDVPLVSIASSARKVTEGGKTKFVVTRKGDLSDSLVVKYKIGGTAKNGKDYKELDGTVEIPAGKASAQIVVRTDDDTKKEDHETIVLSLKDLKRYEVVENRDAAVVTIVDNDAKTRGNPNLDVVADLLSFAPFAEKIVGLFDPTIYQVDDDWFEAGRDGDD